MYEENLNQMDFAKKISCTQTQISEWINGNSKPSYDNLQMIGKIFNIDGNKILDLEQKNKVIRNAFSNKEIDKSMIIEYAKRLKCEKKIRMIMEVFI